MPGRGPLVSCLLVTLPSAARLPLVSTSIEDYCRQTHERRELVIVVDEAAEADRLALRSLVNDLGRRDIRVVEAGEKQTLGALRNASIANARGDVLCQWDDDDRHHPSRIERQLAELERTEASAVFLQEVFQCFAARRELFWTNWVATEPRCLPGTILFRAGAGVEYPTVGDEASIEDHVACMDLQSRGEAAYLAGCPELYVYVFHGANFRTEAHHRMLATELAISRRLLERREQQIRDGLAVFDFDGYTVTGSNGPAFTLTRSV